MDKMKKNNITSAGFVGSNNDGERPLTELWLEVLCYRVVHPSVHCIHTDATGTFSLPQVRNCSEWAFILENYNN